MVETWVVDIYNRRPYWRRLERGMGCGQTAEMAGNPNQHGGRPLQMD